MIKLTEVNWATSKRQMWWHCNFKLLHILTLLHASCYVTTKCQHKNEMVCLAEIRRAQSFRCCELIHTLKPHKQMVLLLLLLQPPSPPMFHTTGLGVSAVLFYDVWKWCAKIIPITVHGIPICFEHSQAHSASTDSTAPAYCFTLK